jgi:hypothetical protein
VATLAVQKGSRTGVALTFTAAAGGGDQFPAGGARALHVKNGSGSSMDVTVNSQKPCDQGVDHDIVVSVAAGAEKVISGLTYERFADANGYVQVTYSLATSVTVAVVEA